ncbi:hypothetical protein [Streptomyces sp. NBC_01451]|uniref:hypothetical protein n=1 Tax=Streptomyces sp. NBC_01451 TaxID=2903872 RepID=UPI003FCEC2F8
MSGAVGAVGSADVPGSAGVRARCRAVALALGIVTVRAPRTVTGSQSDSVTRVADFYGACIDARSGPGDGGRLAAELRKYDIHADCLKKLVAWEAKNHADGVLRAQDVPVRWTVTDNGTADHAEAGITLTWGSRSPGSTTGLVVDLTRDHRIIGIGTKGVGGK